MQRFTIKVLAAAILVVSAMLAPRIPAAPAQESERVTAIKPPATPLPPEAESRGITQFSFIVYGDTRGRRDGTDIQYEHSLVIEAMLKQIKNLAGTPFPVRFVLQSGDAVSNGTFVQQWNVSFVPLIDRLTTEGNIPFYLVVGNHERADTPQGLRNYLAAVANLIPPEGSPRRMPGGTAFSLGYGNTFVIALDADIAGDESQFQWVKSQLEGLDRKRYANVIVFCHQAPFSSGYHGGARVEQPTVDLRAKYMPLFNAHHVRMVFSGHEHLFEHWVERYSDASGPHRMDLVISGGGGAPPYQYTGEPDLREYLKTNEATKVTLEHLVKPGIEPGLNPHHFVIVRVAGEKLDMEVIPVDWGRGFQPYRSNKVEMQDRPQ